MAFPSASGYGNLPNGSFSPVIYSQKVLKSFRRVSVIEAISNTDYSGEIANYGDTVQIILEPDVVVSPYVRGQTVVPTDLLDTNTTLIVDHANKFAFKVDDIEAKQSHINWESLAVERAAFKLKDAFDAEVLSYMAGQAGTVIGSSSVPTVVRVNPPTGGFSPLNILARLNRKMDEQNVPTDGRWVVGDPFFWEQMQQEESRLMQVNQTGDSTSPLRPGMWNGRIIEGEIRGFSCYLSNSLLAGGTGSDATGANNYGTLLAGHMSSTATVSQIAKTETYRDPDSFADVVRGLHMYGRKTLRTNALARVYWQRG